MVGALVDTGLPNRFFKALLSCTNCSGTSMVQGWCAYWFAAIVIFLSNLISNVPVILMLEPLLKDNPSSSLHAHAGDGVFNSTTTDVATMGMGMGAGLGAIDEEHVRYVWIIVAWVATAAGNFMLIGSAANLIVAHQAFKAGDETFTATRHGKFGLPTTLLIICLGLYLLSVTQNGHK